MSFLDPVHSQDAHLLGWDDYEQAICEPNYTARPMKRKRLFNYDESFKIIHKTDKAILFEDGKQRKFWVPRALLSKTFEGRWMVYHRFDKNYINAKK